MMDKIREAFEVIHNTDKTYIACPMCEYIADVPAEIKEHFFQSGYKSREAEISRPKKEDDIQAEEIQSLKEQIKIACKIVKYYEPTMSERDFLHDLTTGDFQDYMEFVKSENEEISRLKEEIERYKGELHDHAIFSRERYELIESLKCCGNCGHDIDITDGGICDTCAENSNWQLKEKRGEAKQ